MDVLSFLRNAEYMMPYTVGFTSINCRLTPTLSYTINDRARFTGGLQFDNIVGSDSIIHLFPFYRMEYEPTAWVRIVLGNIYGGAEHGLEDPLYDRERNYFSYFYHPEAGVQVLTSTNRWKSDTWIDWEHYLNPWTHDQERFTIATRHEFMLKQNGLLHASSGTRRETDSLAPPSRLGISIPITAIVAHRGGQFSLMDTNNESLLNFHAGLRLTLTGTPRHAQQGLTYSTWSLYLPFFYFRDISGADMANDSVGVYHHPFQNGWGMHPQLSWERPLFHSTKVLAPQHPDLTKPREHYTYLSAALGYWHGHQYLSSRGSYLYQSACWTSDATFPKRSMLTLDTRLEHRYKGLAAGVDIQLYYDLDRHKSDYAYGLYMRWNILRRINRYQKG